MKLKLSYSLENGQKENEHWERADGPCEKVKENQNDNY